MQLHFKRPGDGIVRDFSIRQQTFAFSYPEVGYATGKLFPAGYDHDRTEIEIGKGQPAFLRACQAIRTYDHFPQSWSFVVSETAESPRPGQTVGVSFYQLGLWWLSGARIIEVIDKTDFYGFSYGTLPSHVERGEELFYTRRDAEGRVYYGIQAYSRPRFWGAKLIKPYARWQQARFRRDSGARMQQLVTNA